MARQVDLGKQHFWLQHLQRWQHSRLSVRDYCARHHLREPNFYCWRRVLHQRGLWTPALVDSTAAADAPAAAAPPLFVAATLTPIAAAPEPLELVLPDGLAVRVAAGFDDATLRRLLALLREPPC